LLGPWYLVKSNVLYLFKEAYSTPIFPLDILAERLPEKKFEWVSNHAIACAL
jgi:hypothetical protein